MIAINKQTPTNEVYGQLQLAFDFFNQRLFASDLPPVIFVLQRAKKTAGHYCNERWQGTDERKADEISINPTVVRELGFQEAMQTLVHEMCHQWQYHFGTPSRVSYHNREWAQKMEAVGLIPSSTGRPGGKKTGQKIADYPAEDGPFLSVLAQLKETGFELTWNERLLLAGVSTAGESESESKQKNKVKYTCPTCQLNVWGKPDIKVGCWECNKLMELAE